jgi:hypothetical protein
MPEGSTYAINCFFVLFVLRVVVPQAKKIILRVPPLGAGGGNKIKSWERLAYRICSVNCVSKTLSA